MDVQTARPDETELSRAQGYLLLSTLLARPPSEDLLRQLAAVEGDASEWGAAVAGLAAAASRAEASSVKRVFHRLFIGLGRGELMPYASYYVTGFLQDRPLVAVRRDLARLGIARDQSVKEPEDHVAALLETMGGLIDGRFGEPAPRARQRDFFEAHLAGWAPVFFRDLEGAEEADFYRPVGRLGLVLLEIEGQAFGMDIREGSHGRAR
jgi:TorA maturation chaperone TorD